MPVQKTSNSKILYAFRVSSVMQNLVYEIKQKIRFYIFRRDLLALLLLLIWGLH
jgi:hypothetical protein